MNGLPEIVWISIFKNFDLLERLKLRLVCSKWRQIIESLSVQDLSIVDSRFYGIRLVGVGFEAVNYQSLLHYSRPSSSRMAGIFSRQKPLELANSLRFACTNSMFASLKCLFISVFSFPDFCFDRHINPYFGQLEELTCFYSKLRGKNRLSLPRLKRLSFLYIVIDIKPVQLELPNLFKFLTTASVLSFEFTYPQSITHLTVEDDHESVVQFVNLKYFGCLYYPNRARIVLSKLAKLKEFHVYHYIAMPIPDVAAFYQTKQSLGRYEVKIIFFGILAYEDWLNSKRCLNIRTNYAKLHAPQLFCAPEKLNFDDLTAAFDFGQQELSADLEIKLPGIKSLTVSRSLTGDEVEWFFRILLNYPNLLRLHLDSPLDEQRHYDLLPLYCKRIRTLRIQSNSENPVDLRFALEFHKLLSLKTNLKLRRQLIRSFFKQLNYFQILKFHEMTRRLTITRHKRHKKTSIYTLEMPFGNKPRKFWGFNFNQMLELTDHFQFKSFNWFKMFLFDFPRNN